MSTDIHRPADDVSVGAAPRPWSVAAAMEPLPPLAPPPARPGRGVSLTTTPRSADGPPGRRTVIAVAILFAVVAVIVVIVLVLGR